MERLRFLDQRKNRAIIKILGAVPIRVEVDGC